MQVSNPAISQFRKAGVMKIKNSSNIAGINYAPRKKVLTVDFVNGGKYEYEKVPSGIFKMFKMAVKQEESIGSLFAKIIKGKYEAKKI